MVGFLLAAGNILDTVMVEAGLYTCTLAVEDRAESRGLYTCTLAVEDRAESIGLYTCQGWCTLPSGTVHRIDNKN